MVKGTSRQVIVVHSPDPKLFEQAIFILREDAKDVTNEALLKEANLAIRRPGVESRSGWWLYGTGWACAGAGIMALLWFVSTLL